MSCTATTMCYSLAMRTEVGGAGRGLRAVHTLDLTRQCGNAAVLFGVAYHTSAKDNGLMLNICPFCDGAPGAFAQARHKPAATAPAEVYLVCASYLNNHQDVVMAFLDQAEAGAYRDACEAYLATKPVCPPTADSEENDRLWDAWADDLEAWRKAQPIGEFYDCDLVEVKAVPTSARPHDANGSAEATAEGAATQTAASVPVCSCPSGDGSLRWPCAVHPPSASPASVRSQEQAAEQVPADKDKLHLALALFALAAHADADMLPDGSVTLAQEVYEHLAGELGRYDDLLGLAVTTIRAALPAAVHAGESDAAVKA